MKLLARLSVAFQAKFPPNRVVALLTVFVGAPLAGYVSLRAARLGIHLSSGTALAAFITGALGAVTLAYHWLHGWQAHELTQAQLQQALTEPLFDPVAVAEIEAKAKERIALIEGGHLPAGTLEEHFDSLSTPETDPNAPQDAWPEPPASAGQGLPGTPEPPVTPPTPPVGSGS